MLLIICLGKKTCHKKNLYPKKGRDHSTVFNAKKKYVIIRTRKGTRSFLGRDLR